MGRIVTSVSLQLIFFFALSYAVKAQTIVNMPDVNARPSAPAHSMELNPVIDGEVLNDNLWKTITPIDQLWQTKPNAGFPASEKTEIRVSYTPTTFYLAVVCYDKEPGK